MDQQNALEKDGDVRNLTVTLFHLLSRVCDWSACFDQLQTTWTQHDLKIM